ncbi:MAG: hypothetical protein LBK74_01540 [Treponema sp.]|jgi:sugar lactone lactonase YvrE|nr:hypothetical protein [Treponema sp.]
MKPRSITLPKDKAEYITARSKKSKKFLRAPFPFSSVTPNRRLDSTRRLTLRAAVLTAAVLAAAVLTAFAACKNPWIPTLDRDKGGGAAGSPPPQYAWVVTTIAGDGTSGLTDNVPGAAAQFWAPFGITVDAGGNLYVADTENNQIRRINAGSPWNVTTIAGDVGGAIGSNDDPSARFYHPQGITLYDGKLYVADFDNSRIRSIAAGSPWTVGTFAGGAGGNTDGPGLTAKFSGPAGMSADADGNLYVADSGNHNIRKIANDVPRTVTIIAGSGAYPGIAGGADGSGLSEARFSGPAGITVDAAGNLYVADTGNHKIRKIVEGSPYSTVSTIAGAGSPGSDDGIGTDAKFSGPAGITVDAAGILYVADTNNHRIRKIVEGPPGTFTVSTIAGDGILGFTDGAGTAARFDQPRGITVDAAGNLYVADTNNDSIRKLSWQRIN